MVQLDASPESNQSVVPEVSSCSSLSIPTHGQMSGQCSPGIVGQKCVFNCIPGYKLKGQRWLTCQADGEWEPGIPPTCQF